MADDPPECRVCGDPLTTDLEQYRGTHTDCNPGQI